MQVNLVRVDFIVVGSLSSDYARIVDDYERRLTKYVKFTAHEVKAEATQRGEAQVLTAERERIEKVVERVSTPGVPTTIVAMDSRGEQPTTERLTEQWLAAQHLIVLIGGTLGFDDALRSRARQLVSFGRITLPHQLARVVATEQLYRCFRIARNEPYHF